MITINKIIQLPNLPPPLKLQHRQQQQQQQQQQLQQQQQQRRLKRQVKAWGKWINWAYQTRIEQFISKSVKEYCCNSLWPQLHHQLSSVAAGPEHLPRVQPFSRSSGSLDTSPWSESWLLCHSVYKVKTSQQVCRGVWQSRGWGGRGWLTRTGRTWGLDLYNQSQTEELYSYSDLSRLYWNIFHNFCQAQSSPNST